MTDITPAATVAAVDPSAHIAPWLTKPYIITKAMKQCCHQLSLTVLSQSFADMYQHELEFFIQLHPQKASQQALIRKIYLHGDDVPWSFGRTVIPMPTFTAYSETFNNLDTKPIGESFLYKNNATRSSFQYFKLLPQTLLHQEATTNYHTNDTLWGRRSIFSLPHGPLMITEIYLPPVPAYPDEDPLH